jgi:cysteine-rich repeat protein
MSVADPPRYRPSPRHAARRYLAALACTATALAIAAHGTAWAHPQRFSIGGKKVVLKVGGKPQKRKFAFASARDDDITARHDPRADGAALLVSGAGGRSALVELDPQRWKGIGNPRGSKGYRYVDASGTRGGVTKVVVKRGSIAIRAGGETWPWVGAPGTPLWVWFRLGDEWFCAGFEGSTRKSKGPFVRRDAQDPGACPDQVCGNGEMESGESCDDGNLGEVDGCTSTCSLGACEGPEFDDTFTAIQTVVLDGPVYACSTALCHDDDAPTGDLDLTAGVAYASLLGADRQGAPSAASTLDRVLPGEPAQSFLYEKLAAKTLGTGTTGTPMPQSPAPALTAEHLEAVERWIRAGAPEEGVVGGTAELLGACLPPPDPLKIPPPDPPAPGTGVQLQQTAWPLPAGSESEVCLATYHDFGDIVPPSDQIDCPPQYVSIDNPSGKCIRYHRQTLFQDPQSHHSIIHFYTGEYALEAQDDRFPSRRFGPFTYKFNDLADPRNGQPCDPRDIDPALGFNPGCSGAVRPTIACLGYGPLDFNTGGVVGGGPTAPAFSGSQEPFYELELASGVYNILPVRGVVVWNSHAFNLTDSDSTMAQYLNLDLAGPADQLHEVQGIFDAGSIFVQDVPPFQTREYCRTYTAAQGTHLIQLGSHTHRHGVRFRIWEPPNTPCAPGDPACVPGPVERLIYVSTEYSDPVMLDFAPPRVLDAVADAERTYLYCSLYDNGSTPTSPSVKRRSASPAPGLPLFPGGPCGDDTVACMAGPRQGELCGGGDTFCDSTPGAGDGACDACPLRGGVTTEDEMLILLGFYFLP